MTRAQVARRLGKSIATVRRMEGSELHPSVDGRGINRFDPGEVERVAIRQVTSNAQLSAVRSFMPFRGDDTIEDDVEDPSESTDKEALEREMERTAAQARTIERLQNENREVREAVQVCATLIFTNLTPKQMAVLGEDGLAALELMIRLCG